MCIRDRCEVIPPHQSNPANIVCQQGYSNRFFGSERNIACGVHGKWSDHQFWSLLWHFKKTRKSHPEQMSRSADFWCHVFVPQCSPSHCLVNTRSVASIQVGVFDHPPYSPDLAPSDFYWFMNTNKWLGSQGFDYNEELHDAVTGWLQSNAAEFYGVRISKLVKCYDKCLKLNVEK